MEAVITIDFDNIACNNINYEINDISFDYDEELKQLYDFFGENSISACTAFVRIDKQIKETFNDYLHVLHKVPSNSAVKTEIAWHPHLYSRKIQYEYLKDEDYALPELWETYHENNVIKNMKSVRIGNAMMSNNIMGTLDNMGFIIDSSALPGCIRNDEKRKYDWSCTGNSPYHPCVQDYRIPAAHCYRILEVPMTTTFITAPYDKSAKRRYLNPTIKSEIFQRAIANYGRQLPYMVLVLHPDQLMKGYEDDLYRYGMENFKSNMKFIMEHFPGIKFKSLDQCLT